MRLVTVRYPGYGHCGHPLRVGGHAWAAPELDPTGGSVPMLCTKCGDERRAAERARLPVQRTLPRTR